MSHPTIKHYMAWATDSHSYINHNYIQIHLSPQIHIIPRKFKHNKMLIESKDKCHICLLHSFMTSIITKYIPYSVLGLQVILGIGLLASRYERHSKLIKDKNSHSSIKSQTLYAKPVEIIHQVPSFLRKEGS